MKSTFKYLINKIDKIIIKGHHKTRWIQSGGENFISTIIASKIIKIFKKNIAKKLGPSPRSLFDRLNPQSHLSFIFKKVLNTDCLPH